MIDNASGTSDQLYDALQSAETENHQLRATLTTREEQLKRMCNLSVFISELCGFEGVDPDYVTGVNTDVVKAALGRMKEARAILKELER